MSQRKAKEERRKLRQLEKAKEKEITADGLTGLSFRQIILENKKFLLALMALAIGLYVNAMWGHFVSDDYASITQNPGVKNFSFMASTYNLMSLTTFLIAAIFGIESPVSFHLVSLVFYLLSLVAGFVLIRLLFDKKIAVLTLLLFAVLPIHVEAVAWISGRNYLMMSLFTLLALDFCLLYFSKEKVKYLWLTAGSLFLGFATDRVRPLAFAFLLALFLLSFNKKLKKPLPLGKIAIGTGVFLALFFVFFWPLVMDRINGVNSGYNASESIFYNPFFQYPTAMAKYLQLLLVPIDLTLYHTMYVIPVWLNWMILGLYLVMLGYFYFKNRNLFFALSFVFVATAPSMAPVKVSWLVAERYMFLGSLGWCLFLVLAFLPLAEKAKSVFTGLFVVLLVIYGGRVVWRNVDWQTNHKLWVNTVQVSPNSHNAWNNIGDDYDKLQDYENAVKGFSQSTVMKSNYADAFHNRANIYYKMGRLDLARDSYNTALQFSPGLYQTYLSLVQIDLNEGRADLAMEHANKVVELQPQNFQSYYVRGIVLARVGMKDEAISEMKKSLQLNPGFTSARQAIDELETSAQ